MAKIAGLVCGVLLVNLGVFNLLDATYVDLNKPYSNPGIASILSGFGIIAISVALIRQTSRASSGSSDQQEATSR